MDDAAIRNLAARLAAGEINIDEFTEQTTKRAKLKKEVNDLILINIAQHYYLPLIVSKYEKLDYIKHIIDVKSERLFVESLVENIKSKSKDPSFDWMFSKIDQTIDDKNIAMPYFDAKDNNYHDFYPDFIFWIKKGNDYKIVFVDPKGTEYTSYIPKVDAFEKLFFENGAPKVFKYKNGDINYNVTFDLKLYYDGTGTVPEKYKSYWCLYQNFEWLS